MNEKQTQEQTRIDPRAFCEHHWFDISTQPDFEEKGYIWMYCGNCTLIKKVMLEE